MICHGGSAHNPFVLWIDFNTSREEIFTFIDAVPITNQPVSVKAAELIKQVGKETLSWSPGSYRSFDRIGTLFRFDIEVRNSNEYELSSACLKNSLDLRSGFDPC